MSEFICKTLSPEIFWTALSALGTLAAVLVALFLPIYAKKREYKNIENFIYKEFEWNLKILKLIEPFDTDSIIPTTDITTSSNTLDLSKFMILRLTIWNEYKFKISLYKPLVYDDLENFNLVIEEIIELVHRDSISDSDFINLKMKYYNLSGLLKQSKYKDKI